MKRQKKWQSSAATKLILWVATLMVFVTAEAVPIDRVSNSGGAEDRLAEVVSSINEWYLSEELKLVHQDLQLGKRKRAKLRLARYLALNKNDARALTIAGLVLLEEKKYEDAEESFSRVLRQGFKTADLYAFLGVSAYMQDNQLVAERNLKKATEINPHQILALRYLALLSVERKHPVQALGYYEKILETSGYQKDLFTRVHLNFADTLIQVGEPERAIKVLVNQNVPKQLAVGHGLVLAEAYARIGDQKSALSALNRLSGEDVSELNLGIEKARVYAKSGNPAAGLKHLEGLIESHQDSRAALYFEKGMMLAGMGTLNLAGDSLVESSKYSSDDKKFGLQIRAAGFYRSGGNLSKAENILRGVLKNNPDELNAKYQLAALLAQTEGVTAASRLLDQILDTDKNYYKAHYLLGVISWNQKNTAKALLHFNNAVNINPQFVEGWLALSEVEHIRSGDSKTEIILETGLERNPGNPALRYQLASLSFAEGDFERVLSLLEKFPESSAGYGDAQSLAVLAMISLGKPEADALQLLERANTISPNNVYLADAEGYLLARNGKLREGIDILRKAANVAGDDAIIYLHLSEALLLDGQTQKSKLALTKVIALGVESNTEELMLDKLKAKLNM